MSTIPQLTTDCQEVVQPAAWPAITFLPLPPLAEQHGRIKVAVERAISGDWAEMPIDAVLGNLHILGATINGCLMWEPVIAAGRARLDMERGVISREAFEGLYGDELDEVLAAVPEWEQEPELSFYEVQYD